MSKLFRPYYLFIFGVFLSIVAVAIAFPTKSDLPRIELVTTADFSSKLSSECAASRGAILSHCTKDQVTPGPIEDKCPTCDLGLTFLINLSSIFSGKAASKVLITKIIISFTWVLLLLSALSFYRVGWRRGAALYLILGSIAVLISKFDASHYSAIFAAFILGLWGLSYLVRALDETTLKRALVLSLFCFLCISLTFFIREPVGLAAKFASAVLLLGFLFKPKIPLSQKLIKAGVLVTLLMLASGFWVESLKKVRHALWNVPKTNVVSQHGVEHSLTINLGHYSNNPWGIVAGDGTGLHLVKHHDPKIEFLTPEYFKALGSIYFALWKNYPQEMIRIYSQKVREVLSFNARLPFGFYLPLLVIFLLAFVSLKHVRQANLFHHPDFQIGLGFLLFSAGSFMQGVLVNPYFSTEAQFGFWIAIIFVGSFLAQRSGGALNAKSEGQ